MSGEIFLGDLATCLGALRPDEEGSHRVARLLGFRLVDPGAQSPPPPIDHLETPQRPTDTTPPAATPPPTPAPPRHGEPAALVGVALEALEPRALPAWSPLPPLPAQSQPFGQPPVPPLLTPGWTRGILAGATASWSPDGDPDERRVVEALAHHQPMGLLPRHLLPTLRRGCELRVDIGPAMTPWSADVAQLYALMDGVVGRGRWSASVFTDPLRSDDGRPWMPDEPGRVVLLVGPATPEAWGSPTWATLHERAAWRGCAVVALVPWDALLARPAIRRAAHLVTWDRVTTARRARRPRPAHP